MSKEYELLQRLVNAVGDCEDTEAVLAITRDATILLKEGDRLDAEEQKRLELDALVCEAHGCLTAAQELMSSGREGEAWILMDAAARVLGIHAG